MENEIEPIIENSVNEILTFFNDLSTLDKKVLLRETNCTPNGPGCINFNKKKTS